MDMRGRLDVDRDAVGAGRDEVRHLPLGPLDHQVHVDDRAGRMDLVGERRDDVRAERDRRHEVAVHHINVDHARAGREHLADLRAQPREVGRQDRRRDLARTERSRRSQARSCHRAFSMLPWQ